MRNYSLDMGDADACCGRCVTVPLGFCKPKSILSFIADAKFTCYTDAITCGVHLEVYGRPAILVPVVSQLLLANKEVYTCVENAVQVLYEAHSYLGSDGS